MSRPIRLTGVRQNNLKNISVEFPARKISVVTGLSGSGKSSLVFDTLYAEGQRRYVESLSTYTRQFLEKMPKPELDSIENIPPAIALEQRNHVVNSRSTVATQTEILDYLRVLYAKIGQTACIRCGHPVHQMDSQSILDWACHWLPSRKALIVAPLEQRFTETPKAKTPKQKGRLAKQAQKSQKTANQKQTHLPAKSTSKTSMWTQLIPLLKEQGYQRILLKIVESKRTRFELLELPDESLTLDSALLNQLSQPQAEHFVVVDRLKIPPPAGPNGETDSDTRSRVLGSIDQALTIGQGRVGFFDMSLLNTDLPQEFSSSLTQGSASLWKLFDHRFCCIECGLEHRPPEPHLFSFNSPLGACSQCSGFGFTLDIDESLVVPDPSKTLKNGAIDPFSKPFLADWEKSLFRFAERNGISIGKRYRELTGAEKKLLWRGNPDDTSFGGIIACFEELKRWKYKIHVRVFIRRYQKQTLCSECKGSRLKPEALAVKIAGKSIADCLSLSVQDSLKWIQGLHLKPNEKKIAKEVFTQVERRLFFLEEVGVGYLTLSRLAKSLSGGEFQRINLATQLGNGLCGTLYVLDEPSIGLHAADTARLVQVLHRLRDQGNSVVVVEHDLDVMRAADWLVELGPGAGRHGGELIVNGNAEKLMKTAGSITGKYLAGDFRMNRDRPRRPEARRWLKLQGCRENNLKNITVKIPLDRLVLITGVSGSGKSTLVHRILHDSLTHLLYQAPQLPGDFDRIYGADQLGGVVLLDQTPIGKSSRSNPATYLKAWDEIRKLLANQVLSLRRGYTPQHFSFNVDGGRCPTCKGEGEITLDMHFMAEVKLPCEECEGTRFKKKVLDVTYRGKNVDRILNSTIDEAFELFRENPILARKLGILREVGLGYLRLGQSATTLSGGESQRLKIAATLDDRSAENLLYIFDEPTTGLHLEDIKKLMTVIQNLVEARHSVVMIEHHLDVIAQADWVIDLGPGGGEKGGSLVAQGTPRDLTKNSASVTGIMLNKSGIIPQSLTS